MNTLPESHAQKQQNTVLSLYILAVAMICVKMGIVYKTVFHLNIQSFREEAVLLLASFSSAALFIAGGFLFKKRAGKWAVVAIHFLLTCLLYGNILYYRFYIDFITVPVLFQFKNVGGLSQSTLELAKAPDLLLVADVILLVWLARRGFSLFRKAPKVHPARLLPGLLIVSLFASVWANPGFWKKPYDRELIVKSLGLFNYHLYDGLVYSKSSVNRVLADGTETEEISRYAKGKQEQAGQSDLHGIARGKNVIVVFLESTQQFVLDREINGEEVTPFLNQLKKDSLYFPDFYHQTAQGKTSDAEFLLDNSLYPLPGGSVFVRRPENEFYSLPKILKEQGYYSASFHGNDAYFWNRTAMYESLGYDRFYSKADFTVTAENSVNYGLKDIPFFEQAMPYIEKLPEPFYAKFLTLTNHFPYLIDPEDQYISEADTQQGVVNRYFTTVRYEDEAVKKFFGDLKKSGMYDRSIFVLFGDHYGISKSYNEALGELLEKDITATEQVKLQKVPLIIHIPGEEGRTIRTTGGQIDLRATILDLLGAEPEKGTLSFGTSLLADRRNSLAVFRDGSFVTGKYVYTEGACFSLKSGKKTKMNHCAAHIQTADRELGYSDKVIYGDLLRFMDESQ